MTNEQRLRLGTVLRAVANLRGRGVPINRDALRLYVRCAVGILSPAQVTAALQARAVVPLRRLPGQPGTP